MVKDVRFEKYKGTSLKETLDGHLTLTCYIHVNTLQLHNKDRKILASC